MYLDLRYSTLKNKISSSQSCESLLGGVSFLGGWEEGLGVPPPWGGSYVEWKEYQLRMRFQSVFSGQVFIDVCYYRTLVVTKPLDCQGIVRCLLLSIPLKTLRALPGKARVWWEMKI